jgi:uncharacterized protein YggE
MRIGPGRAAILICATIGAVAGFVRQGVAQESTPRPTPTPLCARPNYLAFMIQPAPAIAPPLAEQQGIHGTVQVVVSLDTDSRVVGARIQSSPSAVLNPAALTAARHSTFRTESYGCRPIAADYIVTYDFVNKVTFATTASGEQTLSVIGEGIVTRPADAAVVRVTIVTRDAVSQAAMAKNDALFDTLERKLAALGIGERNIGWMTSVRSRAFATPEPTSETMVSRPVVITVDNLANAGHVAAAAASLSSDQAVAIRYELKNHADADREARNIALKDAENAAQAAAASQSSGWHLGVMRAVVPPSVISSPPPAKVVPYRMIPVVGGFQEPFIDVPYLEVRATATVTYAIKP